VYLSLRGHIRASLYTGTKHMFKSIILTDCKIVNPITITEGHRGAKGIENWAPFTARQK